MSNKWHLGSNQAGNLRGKKLNVWEGGIHVAAFINWPGRMKPGEVKEDVHIIDWFPTLAKVNTFDTLDPLHIPCDVTGGPKL